MTADELSPEHLQSRFEELQERLVDLWDSMHEMTPDPQTIVVVPSLSLELLEGSGLVMAPYEERYLFLLFLLRQPLARMIYVTSEPIHPSVVDYYLEPGARRAAVARPPAPVHGAGARRLVEAPVGQAPRTAPPARAHPRAHPRPSPRAPRALPHHRPRTRPRGAPRHPDVRRRSQVRRLRHQERRSAALRRGGRAPPGAAPRTCTRSTTSSTRWSRCARRSPRSPRCW